MSPVPWSLLLSWPLLGTVAPVEQRTLGAVPVCEGSELPLHWADLCEGFLLKPYQNSYFKARQEEFQELKYGSARSVLPA